MVGKNLENNVSQVHNTSGMTLPEGNANIPGIRVPGEVSQNANTGALSDVVNQEVSIPVYDNVSNNWNGLSQLSCDENRDNNGISNVPKNSKETRTIQNAIHSSKILLKHWIGKFQFDMY